MHQETSIVLFSTGGGLPAGVRVLLRALLSAAAYIGIVLGVLLVHDLASMLF